MPPLGRLAPPHQVLEPGKAGLQLGTARLEPSGPFTCDGPRPHEAVADTSKGILCRVPLVAQVLLPFAVVPIFRRAGRAESLPFSTWSSPASAKRTILVHRFSTGRWPLWRVLGMYRISALAYDLPKNNCYLGNARAPTGWQCLRLLADCAWLLLKSLVERRVKKPSAHRYAAHCDRGKATLRNLKKSRPRSGGAALEAMRQRPRLRLR
jgi:hypothetical protein